MRIVTLNVNGIRSAQRKGMFNWLRQLRGWDFLSLQEIRAHDDILGRDVRPRNAFVVFNPALKKGYSGVALYSRKVPARTHVGFGSQEFDAEGRYLQADYRDLSIITLYMPSGSSSPERQQAKFRFMDEFFPHLGKLRREGREVIVCGDWNIAHEPIDLKNWRSNQQNSGFLPEEREWLSRVFRELGYVDVFRRVDPRPDQYTWWSNRGQAWLKNVGWRIDYQIATPGIATRAKKVSIYKAQRFSDHAPLVIDYDYQLL